MIPDNHYYLSVCDKIDGIMQPLKEQFGFTSFVYLKSFNDGSEIRLANQSDWLLYYYQHELYKYSLFERHPSEYIKSYVPWAGLKVYQAVLEKSRLFNIDHGITIIEPDADGCEFYFLGTTVDRADIMPKYLANIDLLKRFIIQFQENAKSILKEAAHHKLTIPNKFFDAPKLYCLKEVNRKLFLNLPDNIEFTARELDCVKLLAKGYTQKMIAKELGISIRTVETHLNHAKDKTQTNSRGELAKYFLDYLD